MTLKPHPTAPARRFPTLLAAATALLLWSPVSVAEEPVAQPFVGFWESAQVSRGGIGSALGIGADGGIRQIAVARVETEYRLDDGTLYMADESGTEQALPVTLGEDTMEMTGPDGSAVVKERFRDPTEGESPVVGDWSYDYFGRGEAFERYTVDGRMLFRFPMRTDEGSWEIDGGRLEVTFGGEERSWAWSMDGEELLIGPPGEEVRYRRVRVGAWYLPAE